MVFLFPLLEHSHQSVHNRKICKTYIALPKNDPHQFIYNYVNLQVCYIVTVGPKDLGTPTYFISSPMPMLRRKKCPRTNKGNPNCQDILPRMTLSLADQNHRRGKCHVARGSLLEHPKGSSEPNGPTIGAW